MKPNLIFSGPIGSGKTTISRKIAASLGYGWNSFGATVKRIAIEHSIPVRREDLQALGERLIADESPQFCLRVLQEAEGFPLKPVVIDGLRHAHIRSVLQELSISRLIVCIFVDVDDVTRFSRIQQRDALTAEKIRLLDSHSTEIEVSEGIRGLADFIANNNGAASSCCAAIREWLLAKQFVDSSTAAIG
jgi:cytidylate kinase